MLCTLCERVFTSRYKLRTHMKTEHEIECSLDQMHICDQCHSRHGSSSDMNDHYVTEHDYKNEHLCSQCDKMMASKMLLTIHLMEAHEFNPIGQVSHQHLLILKLAARWRLFVHFDYFGHFGLFCSFLTTLCHF